MNLQTLKSLPKEKVQEVLESLSTSELEELQYTWEFWARPDQLEPDGNWKIWLNLSGRGAGKTRSLSEWVRKQIKSSKKRGALIAPTRGDIRRVLVEGESGILNVCWEGDKTVKGTHLGRPSWSPTNNTLTWANGAKVECFSAEDPERLRGPQFEFAGCDEVAAWRNMEETWSMLQYCLRLGKKPRIYVTTTPKPVKLVRKLYKDTEDPESGVVYSSVSSYANADNIDLGAMKAYEGTRLGRQELYAEILEEAAGALWNTEMIDKCQVYPDDVPELQRIVVSLDPATTATTESDMTGIIVAGVDINGSGYILEDATGEYFPAQWAAKTIELFHKWKADRVVAEGNQGGDMVKHTITSEWEAAPIKVVYASRGKYARAEPISALYEQGKVKHLPDLTDLEQQMITWEPLGSMGSPDRLDAMVWAVTELMLGGVSNPQIHLGGKSKEELSAF